MTSNLRKLVALTCLASAFGLPVTGDTGDVASSVHNLSVSGPGEVRALNETEVCKFCHIPHNAVVPAPLWGHALSNVKQYETSRVRTGRSSFGVAPQPDGSSRLCLSCHDGTVALGEIAGEPRAIQMAGTQRLGRGRRGHLGTDLSGSHPISFVVPDGSRAALDSDVDMGLRPLGVIKADKAVRLDARGKMQCTTCHDAHTDRYYQADRVPRFWVKPTVGEVCLTCHELR
jgi:hypothetical protein